MGRILAIDYGIKRCGLAVTDTLQIIATGLDTVETPRLLKYLKEYCKKEEVDSFVLGSPKNLNNTDSEAMEFVRHFKIQLEKTFPGKTIAMVDERFTSKMAFQSMIDGGLKKMQRRNKAMIDKVSATIILQSYMEQQNR